MSQRFTEVGYRFKTGERAPFEHDRVVRDASFKPPIVLQPGDVLEIWYDEDGTVLGGHLSQRIA